MRESDIVFELGDYWVYRDRARARYTVFAVVGTHSQSDSAYALTPDGLSVAVAPLWNVAGTREVSCGKKAEGSTMKVHKLDDVSREFILCPECGRHVHTSPAEGVTNQSLRACNECDAVFFMDLSQPPVFEVAK